MLNEDERKYKRWQTLEDIDRAAALLGPDSNSMTRSRKAGRRRGRRRKLEKILDKLMKDFLITVEAQRRERGLESMTGNRPNKTKVDWGASACGSVSWPASAASPRISAALVLAVRGWPTGAWRLFAPDSRFRL